ncbi:substrate-binding periplasmic protein [Reinekea sp.]|jgi:polar amino acid transport system substrate-binding protein|uniref:substrate-binding periplasmic protein n=1 Tax=Reinekea sp. TaxID=1970455 RepID=UPI003988CA72
MQQLMVFLHGFILMVVLASSATADAHLTLYTSSNGIYSHSVNGREFEHHTDMISGMAVQFVKDLFQEAGVEYNIKLRNLSVGLRRVNSEPNVGFFAMSRDDSAEDNLIWLGPIARDYWALYKTRQSSLSVASMSDLSKFKIGAQKDSPIAMFLSDAGIPINVESKDRVNPYRLNYGLIDLWATSRSSAFKLAFETGFPEIMEAQELTHVELYLALNSSVDPQIVDRLTKAYNAMIIKGRKWY